MSTTGSERNESEKSANVPQLEFSANTENEDDVFESDILVITLKHNKTVAGFYNVRNRYNKDDPKKWFEVKAWKENKATSPEFEQEGDIRNAYSKDKDTLSDYLNFLLADAHEKFVDRIQSKPDAKNAENVARCESSTDTHADINTSASCKYDTVSEPGNVATTIPVVILNESGELLLDFPEGSDDDTKKQNEEVQDLHDRLRNVINSTEFVGPDNPRFKVLEYTPQAPKTLNKVVDIGKSYAPNKSYRMRDSDLSEEKLKETIRRLFKIPTRFGILFHSARLSGEESSCTDTDNENPQHYTCFVYRYRRNDGRFNRTTTKPRISKAISEKTCDNLKCVQDIQRKLEQYKQDHDREDIDAYIHVVLMSIPPRKLLEKEKKEAIDHFKFRYKREHGVEPTEDQLSHLHFVYWYMRNPTYLCTQENPPDNEEAQVQFYFEKTERSVARSIENIVIACEQECKDQDNNEVEYRYLPLEIYRRSVISAVLMQKPNTPIKTPADQSATQLQITEIQREGVICDALSVTQTCAAILDAGSSGTRIFLYIWHRRLSREGKPRLPAREEIELPFGWDPRLARTKPGVSALVTKKSPGRVKEYLASLFEYVAPFLKKNGMRISSTPLFMLATGGMRDLQQRSYGDYNILVQEIKDYLKTTGYDCPVYETIGGEDEGLYGWIAANFNAQRFQKESQSGTRGFMEMGGQTAQIAFVPTAKAREHYEGPLRHMKIGLHSYQVFSRTWPILGADAMWRRHLERLQQRSNMVMLYDPCLPKGYSMQVETGDEKRIVQGTGNFLECIEEVFRIVQEEYCPDSECRAGKLCVFRNRGGCLLHTVPGLGFDQAKTSFYGASVFWSATNGVFGGNKKSPTSGAAANNNPYDVRNFAKEVMDLFCQDWETIKELRPSEKSNGYQFLPFAFFKAALIMVTLHLGFGVPMPGFTTEGVKAYVERRAQQLRGNTSAKTSMDKLIKILSAMFEDLALPPDPDTINCKYVATLRKKLEEAFSGEATHGELSITNLDVTPAGHDSSITKEHTPENVALQEFRKAMRAPESKKLKQSAFDDAVRRFVEEAAKARWGLNVLQNFLEGLERTIKTATSKLVWRFVTEATVNESTAEDGEFAALKDSSWTLGRIVLYSIDCTPTEQFPTSWDPTHKIAAMRKYHSSQQARYRYHYDQDGDKVGVSKNESPPEVGTLH
ncbi:nucleoside phosphatase family-domain-containing protein [Kalaharituber pfeilii]|nr:nucleoside phosphatase family-domain-containing protein [Kalaharituber pfeilii]